MRALAPAGSVLFLALLCGCVHNRQPFPIGLYDVPPASVPEVAAAGFNLVVAPVTPALLQAAQNNGVKVIAESWTSADRTRLHELDRHPALWGWYLQDEPDLNVIAPEKVAAERAQVGFSAKPKIAVLSSGGAAEKFRDAADVLGIDCYPVPWGPVAMVGREMRLARLALRDQPFLAILQAFDWTAFSKLLRTDKPLRAPSYDELRCMSYLAMMQGARGLIFYSYKTESWDLPAHPELWRAVREIASEMKTNHRIFEQRVNWWPAQTEYHGAPEEMYNQLFEARVSLALFKVDRSDPNTARGYYLVAANTSDKPVDFSFKLPFRDAGRISTFCTTNEFTVTNHWVRKTYAPFEICIFGPVNSVLADR